MKVVLTYFGKPEQLIKNAYFIYIFSTVLKMRWYLFSWDNAKPTGPIYQNFFAYCRLDFFTISRHLYHKSLRSCIFPIARCDFNYGTKINWVWTSVPLLLPQRRRNKSMLFMQTIFYSLHTDFFVYTYKVGVA